jgi:hypothetical protein
MLPALYYNKKYTKEYLPSRIRYNQFFFWAGMAAFFYFWRPAVSQFVGI